MEFNHLNGALCASHLAGHLNGMIRLASDRQDYETCILHLKALIRAFTNNEFNNACDKWLYDWNKQLEKYENLRIKRS